MIEILLIATVIYLIMQVLMRKNESESLTDDLSRNAPESAVTDKDNSYDEDAARWIEEFEEHIKYMNREKPELKRSVGVILTMLEEEQIPVKYAGTVIPQCFDSVDVCFKVSYELAMAEYHIEFNDQPDRGSWLLFADVSVNGKKIRVWMPYIEKTTYDSTGLVGEYHVLDGEVVKEIKARVGVNNIRLKASHCGEAEIMFSVSEDMEIAFDFLHSEEHFPIVPWQYCDYESFDPESRWKYVRSRYDRQ